MRAGELHPNPDAGYRFDPGDMVAVMGNAEQLEAFEAMAQG
jgi:K+/H+ antiporter YhaU regulatory subunit KhtT